MNGEMHMRRRRDAKVRYSAAYPTGAERVFLVVSRVERIEVLDRINRIYRIGHWIGSGSGRLKCRDDEL